MEVDLHQGSAFIPFLFAIILVSLTETLEIEAPWQMMCADDVVLCAREKGVLELKLETPYKRGFHHIKNYVAVRFTRWLFSSLCRTGWRQCRLLQLPRKETGSDIDELVTSVETGASREEHVKA